MPLDARETLALARQLAGGDTESSHRAAVSRAYYAALWHARARLIDTIDALP